MLNGLKAANLAAGPWAALSPRLWYNLIDDSDEVTFTEPSTVLSTLPITAILIITTTPRSICYNYPQLPGRK